MQLDMMMTDEPAPLDYTPRQDVHRPSAINPDDYQFVAFGYLGGSDLGALLEARCDRAILTAHMKRTSGKYANVESGGCMVCGNARVCYVSYFYHEQSNTYLRIGWQCAEKLEMAQGDDPDAFKTAIKAARELHAGKRKAEATLADAGLSECWTLYVADYDPAYRFEENTIRDIVDKLVRYGSISEKQESFLRKLEGKVLSVKFPENDYTGRIDHKMLVQHADGWKLWVTVPSIIDDIERGATVKLTATVTPSDDDPKFAFGKRPTKASRVNPPPEEATQ